ncbi:MAG: hypothetical protein GXC70_06315 [Sphingomonadaceae bacterium]|nr:hypothetical protein [Sphingomonadaceae bacterium]
MLDRESRVRFGPVPHELGGRICAPGQWLMSGDSFVSRCTSGYGFRYERGQGVTVERPADPDPDEEALWLGGSVHVAISALNGLLPLHASAVAAGGRAYAFTGPAGAGKSTLAAALGGLGMPLMCDDTLLVDPLGPDPLICLPGRKRLKLLDDALALTGARAEAPVGVDTGKVYARPPGGTVAGPLPLAMLVFLEDGPELRWEPVVGAERFARLEDDHYSQAMFRAAQVSDRAGLFALRARVAGQVRMARLVRPRSPEGFAASVALAAARIAAEGKD